MRRRLAKLLGLAVLAAAVVLLIGLLVFGRPEKDTRAVSPTPQRATPAIQTRALLVPRTVLFGDTVTARVDVTLDRARVDPDSVRVATDFAPWAAIGEPQRNRRDGGTTTHLRTIWTLRCLASVCLPPGRALPLTLTPATVTYDRVGAQAESGQQLTARWPQLVVNTRLETATPTAGFGRSPFEVPWRADMVSMPAVSYRVDPDRVRLPLYAAAGGFALLGLALAYLGRPRRHPRPVLVVAEPPPPVLTPIEQALAMLEDAGAADGVADRRRALELVAAALAGRGDTDLAETARRLAWSKHLPVVERTTPLAEQARPALGLVPEESEPEAEAAQEESNA